MAPHTAQQGESYGIPQLAPLLQLGKVMQNIRTSADSGIHISRRHHCTGKNTQTPADCKPACDTPRAATCSPRDDFQRTLPKDRGWNCCPSPHSDSRSKNLQAKNKKNHSVGKMPLEEEGERSRATCRWFQWGVQLHVSLLHCCASGRCPLQSESELLLELLECLPPWCLQCFFLCFLWCF